MALTQAQKNIIISVSTEPEKILQEFINKPYLLKSFKDKFFQDGSGLMYKILYQFLLTEKSIYFELFQYINENSNLSIFDQKGHKSNALYSVMEIKTSLPNFSLNLLKILLNNKQPITNSAYLIEKHIVDLYVNNYKTDAITLLEKYNNDISHFQNLFHQVLLNDDVDFFKQLLKNDNFKNKMTTLNYFDRTISNKFFGNALYFTLKNKKNNLSTYFIDNNLFKVTNDSSSNFYNRQVTSANIFNNVSATDVLFEKIITQFNTKDLISHLLSKNNSSDLYNNYTFLTKFLNEKYSPFLKDKILYLLNNFVTDSYYDKNQIFKSIFESKISYEDKLFLLQNGMDKNVSERYSGVSTFNSFIFSIQQNTNISKETFNSFISEFKNRNLISEDSIYKDSYFLNMDYFKLINQNSELKCNNPLNFVSQVFKDSKVITKYLEKEKTNIHDEIGYIWLQLSKLDYPTTTSQSAITNPIQLLLHYNLDYYVDFFNENNLKKIINNESFNISNLNKNENSKYFFKFLEKIHESLNFINYPNKFYKLLSFNPPDYLLDKIINHHKLSLENLSKDTTFWDSIYSQRIFDYILNKKIKNTNPMTIYSLCLNSDTTPLELYLQNNCDINFKDDKGNILHSLCSYDGIFRKDAILLILEHHPNLATEINKQGKYPISYLIVDFNKVCKSYLNNQTASNRFKDSVNNYYKVITELLNCGLDSDNKKAFKTIENQLLKYEEINKIFPELLPMLRSGNLTKKLEVKNIKSKNLKI